MKNIILTLLSIPKVGRKSVDYFIKYMKEVPKNENDIVDIFIDIKNDNNKIKVPTLEEVKVAYENANEIVNLSKKQNIETIDMVIVNLYPFFENLFAKENYSIISGLAIGCDTYAHQGCLDANGMTVAVLSSGLNTIYPIKNIELAERIVDNNGCLLSEYPIGVASFKNNFVERDRIESGLSLGTIVIEANIKSGSMHTANFTLKQKRALACLNINKSGNKFLLKNNEVISINGKEDVTKIKFQLEKVKEILENKK